MAYIYLKHADGRITAAKLSNDGQERSFPVVNGDHRAAIWRACIAWSKANSHDSGEAVSEFNRQLADARRLLKRG